MNHRVALDATIQSTWSSEILARLQMFTCGAQPSDVQETVQAFCSYAEDERCNAFAISKTLALGNSQSLNPVSAVVPVFLAGSSSRLL